MNTRVKVLREKLIEAIRTRRAEAVAEHAAVVKAYPGKEAAWRKAVVAVLDGAVRSAKAGKMEDILNRYGDVKLDFPSRPSKPSPEPEVTHYDRSIATLAMSPEETISLTADDFARYVR